jgi:hypothetical protein
LGRMAPAPRERGSVSRRRSVPYLLIYTVHNSADRAIALRGGYRINGGARPPPRSRGPSRPDDGSISPPRHSRDSGGKISEPFTVSAFPHDRNATTRKKSSRRENNACKSQRLAQLLTSPNTHVPVVVCRSVGIWTRGQLTTLRKTGSRRQTGAPRQTGDAT